MMMAKSRRKKRGSCRDAGCDGLSACDCSLFTTLLLAGATLAQVVPPRLADSAGRAAILGYRRWLSPRWPGQCRYVPTCSTYGLAAVEQHGLAVGGRIAAARISSCTADLPPANPPRPGS
ncbi:membrane protein insertion efficiency factor YidD [Micromonospora lutea]|uniref:Membrane protein insertion efficiency factor YidD n=1 Tax=Micromonospora lutea TaxID=419825 RepID=A0ABQ4IPE4_9ACTN|nr:membrane protein insertion efficiency factor YidD [Micromonospora lutea]GIJ19789.1 hypothetical protein Vlu01_04130 [Micromonospora lutea]